MKEIDRRSFGGMVAASLGIVSGCSTVVNVLKGQKARVQTSNGGSAQFPYVRGQPTFEAAPAADGWLVTNPEWMDDNMQWNNVGGRKMSLRRIQSNLSVETFLTVFVGVLPFGYQLEDYRDAHIENRTIHVYAEATETSVGGSDDPNDPEYTYDYSFILWRLLDNAKPPTGMDFNFRLGPLSEETAVETGE